MNKVVAPKSREILPPIMEKQPAINANGIPLIPGSTIEVYTDDRIAEFARAEAELANPSLGLFPTLSRRNNAPDKTGA